MDGSEQPLRYSARIDPAESNTSHAIVLDLVGRGKRVLDVGCASGYLAEALVAQGNKVSGVEIDEDAAETARPYLDRLVVGDLEKIDLVEELGPQEFDVLVFADVLEHLTDPAGVLRRSRPLLAEGGYAVVSIPNVAHGSVRLSLMKGRFDYRPVGLLDETHLRFFTRDQLEQMLADAGFVTVDSRQTTADPFETEIPLDRADYPPEVVAEVEADPESWVYQFVARIDPVDDPADEPSGAATTPTAGTALEVQRLRRALAAIARQAGPGPAQPVVGVLDTAAPPPAGSGAETALLGSLRMTLAVLELRRRLAGFQVRALTLGAEPNVSELGEDVVETLAPWSKGSAAALRAEVDALVVLPGPVDPVAAAALDDIEEAGIPVHRLPFDADHPDPLVLARRLADQAMLAKRRRYLAVRGQAPEADPYLLCLAAPTAGPDLDETAGRALPVVRPEGSLLPIDLLALIDAADAVVTASPGVEAVAHGLERPALDPAEVDRDTLAAATRSGAMARAERRAVLASRADRTFDDVHHAVLDTAGGRLAQTVAERLESLQRRVATLESVNAGLRSTLSRERFVMASEVARRERPPAESDVVWSEFNSERMARDLAAAGAEIARLHGEIHKIYNTRTMRTLAPVRRIYTRVRRLLPGS